MPKPIRCHVCRTAASVEDTDPATFHIVCQRCGPYLPVLPYGSMLSLANALGENGSRRARLSHVIRRQQRTDQAVVLLHVQQLELMNLDEPLPTPSQQLDNLIKWCAARQQVSMASRVPPLEALAWIGAPLTNSPAQLLFWLLDEGAHYFQARKYLSEDPEVTLTLNGWERFDLLQRDAPESKTAFLAMKFGDSKLEEVVASCFQPAAAKAGFELNTLLKRQTAGSIDDQMRVRLRNARFVVADLTHGNNGAYWEAGFAEGLGRPVIYTCRKAEWEKEKTHFDTNHLVTIIWDETDLKKAADQLTATIRATLPAEAAMTDVPR